LYGNETLFPLTGKNLLGVFKNKIIWEIFALRRDEAMEDWKKCQHGEFHNLYSSCNIVGMTKPGMIMWTRWKLKAHAEFFRKPKW
jgi:hypothetical protein